MLTEDLCFDYVIRFRGNIAVTAATGGARTAAPPVQAGGRARVRPRGAEVTADRYRVWNRGLRSGSRHEASLVPRRQQYPCHRQTTDRLVRSQVRAIECTLRDSKDLRFGMGLGTIVSGR